MAEHTDESMVPKDQKKKITFEKRKRANTGCLRGILYFVFILVVSSFLAVFAWNCANDVLALSKPDQEVSVTIAEDYTIAELSRNLKELGVIEHTWLFTLYCNFSDAQEEIEPGTFIINSNLDYHALVSSFVNRVERRTVQVKIPQGLTMMETLRLVADAGVSDYQTLLGSVGSTELDYSILADVPMEPNRLEGFLYPDTYLFYTDSSPSTVYSKFLSNFSAKFAPSFRNQLSQMDYDLNQILTVASLVEKEAASVSEMYEVAYVIYNRLGSANYKKLQIDATGVYLLELLGRDQTVELTSAEIRASRDIDHPYNTFLYEGLPPGPICSPSIDAIRAALFPRSENGNPYFYALSKTGQHEFFESYSAFERFISGSEFAGN
ncbi:MAG: endolytic transglycosylase MltG [Oscillospiraceae bacterium]|jgi:UPF0755 protein|nr:endolytic transglycosylase MltG [Oscillospiraceae bacterium]